MKLLSLSASVSACTLIATAALAQSPDPQPVPMPPPIAAPQDVAYPGQISLSVDATDVTRGIFRVKETIPVTGAGPMTLLYPKWLPGHHNPHAPIERLAGLVVHANGERIEWTRDLVDMAAYHVTVPEGAKTLEVEFQFLSPTDKNVGRVVATPEMLNLQWNAVSLYPAGYYVSRIGVQASVTLPDGWKYGTALRADSTHGDETTFKPVSYETLIDSPMFAGKYYEQVDLDPGAKVPVKLNIVADRPEDLQIPPEALKIHRKLIKQAYKLYGSHHYDHYDFLLALSDHLGGIGLEHHRSSENGVKPDYFRNWEGSFPRRDLLAHEYTHSWNGKFRRGADLWTPNYDVPMRNSYLWVYEGQTQYWGYMLSARSGLMTKQQTLDALADVAATYDARVGRQWRALQDTVNDPIIANRRPLSWRSWQRSEDYYSEGLLIWLDADTLIRERTRGKKSLDDFAKAFFGVDDGSYKTVTYTFDDVVSALNSVTPYDWASFLRERLDEHAKGAPLDGLKRGGYKLVYTDTPSDYAKAYAARRKFVDFTYSLGFALSPSGDLTSVQWDGPAFKAGLTTGDELIAVNGISYDADRLKDAVTAAAKKGADPVELLVKNADHYKTVKIDYHGGLRYPHLERIPGTPARLDDILAAK